MSASNFGHPHSAVPGDGRRASYFTGYFDEYGKIPWPEERAHLQNLEYYLLKHPELIGYIGYFGTSTDELSVMHRRALRAWKYLITRKRVPRARLILLKGGLRGYPGTVLQPVQKGSPPPRFTTPQRAGSTKPAFPSHRIQRNGRTPIEPSFQYAPGRSPHGSSLVF
jgi:hypothetical protein